MHSDFGGAGNLSQGNPPLLAKSGEIRQRDCTGHVPGCCISISAAVTPLKLVFTLDLLHGGIAFGAAFLAGAINSVAGGGTLVSFPALIWLGLNSVAANATSTVAIWPGTVGSAWGYRRELGAAEPRFRVLIVPSLIGGITGALLLRWTPASVFDRLVPFLILFATLLFMAQEPVQRMLKTGDAEAHKSTKWLA